MRVNYRPGTWNALIRDGALLVLPPTVDAALIADAWNGFDGIRELGALVDLLTVRSGGSLASLPDFAAVVADGQDVRVAVRGVPEIVVETADGQTRIIGTDLTTWSERLVRGAARVDVVVESADDVELPVVGGVVRAAAVSLDPTGDSAGISAGVSAVDSAATSTDSVAPAPFAAEPAAAAPPAAEPAGGVPPVVAPAVVAPAVVAPVPPAVGLPSVGAVPAVPPVPPVASLAPADDSEGESPQDEPDFGDTLLPEDDDREADLAERPGDDEPADADGQGDIDEFEMLFGQTIHRPASEPASTDANAGAADPFAASAADADAGLAGDHDGATISAAEARALRKDAPPVSPDAPTEALPVVSGGGRIRVSTGQVVTLDRTVIIGRRPRSTRASGANLPHLVAVESPQQDISRSHLEVRPEGDTVVVIDLHTTNGSTLLRAGSDPMRLHPGEQTIVVSGDVVDLGDGVTVAFEDLP